MVELTDVAQALINGDVSKTEELTRLSIQEGLPAIEILNGGLIAGMRIVGDRFRDGEYFLPEVLLAGNAMKSAMAALKPSLQKAGAPPKGRLAIGTVQNDIHDIGKNLVIMMFEGNGWDVIDLGVDVSAEKFISIVKNEEVDVLGMSALLTTTIFRLGEVINTLNSEGLRQKVKVMVGGVAVTENYAKEIGADGYAPNAMVAVRKAESILNK